jgi:hypothetical protein
MCPWREVTSPRIDVVQRTLSHKRAAAAPSDPSHLAHFDAWTGRRWREQIYSLAALTPRFLAGHEMDGDALDTVLATIR